MNATTPNPIARTIAGLFMIAAAGMAGAPDASARDICAAPDAKEELRDFVNDPSHMIESYYMKLEFERAMCTEQRLKAMVDVADAASAPTAVRAIESVVTSEKDGYIVEVGIRQLAQLALKYPPVAEDALSAISYRLKPQHPADRNDDYVRREAVDAIGEIGNAYDGLRSLAYDHIKSMAGDESVRVRWGVANQIHYLVFKDEKRTHKNDAMKMLKTLSRDADREVRQKAELSLKYMREEIRPAAPKP